MGGDRGYVKRRLEWGRRKKSLSASENREEMERTQKDEGERGQSDRVMENGV